MLIAMSPTPKKKIKKSLVLCSHYLLFAFSRTGTGQRTRKNAPQLLLKCVKRQARTKRQRETKETKKKMWEKEGKTKKKYEMKFTFINHSCTFQTKRNEWKQMANGEWGMGNGEWPLEKQKQWRQRAEAAVSQARQITFRSILLGRSMSVCVCAEWMLILRIGAAHFVENAKMF